MKLKRGASSIAQNVASLSLAAPRPFTQGILTRDRPLTWVHEVHRTVVPGWHRFIRTHFHIGLYSERIFANIGFIV
jgi:hypothetical protein